MANSALDSCQVKLVAPYLRALGKSRKLSRVIASCVVNTRIRAIFPDETAARLLVMEVLTIQKCLFMLPCD